MDFRLLARAAKNNQPIFCLYNRNLDRVETIGKNLPILGRDLHELIKNWNDWNPDNEIDPYSGNNKQMGYGRTLCTATGFWEVRFFNPGDVIRIAEGGEY